MLASKVFCVILLMSWAAPAAAQEYSTYQPQADAIWYQTDNPFRLYWVRGGDTIGTPYRNVGVERHSWRMNGDQLVDVVTDHALDTRRQVKEDTFLVSPRGQVLAIRGPGNVPNGRIDLLLPLPAEGNALVEGFTWSDSLRQDFSGEQGPMFYGITRHLKVAAVREVNGSRVAEISGSGLVQFRLVFVIDSTTGAYMWSDMQGPVEETFEFDVSSGRMLARTWSMDLRGTGGLPNADGAVDTVPSGLRSQQNMRVVTPERAMLWIRDLPGNDTTLTVLGQNDVLLHVAEWGSWSTSASVARNDGTVTTARAEFEDGLPVRFYSVQTSPDTSDHIIELEIRNGTVVRAAQAINLPPRIDTYAVADAGMEELLTPVLAGLSRDGAQHRFVIYRPTTNSWTYATVAQRAIDELVLALVVYDGETEPEYHIYTHDGRLLYLERTGQRQRLPRPNDARRAVVENFIKRLNENSDSS